MQLLIIGHYIQQGSCLERWGRVVNTHIFFVLMSEVFKQNCCSLSRLYKSQNKLSHQQEKQKIVCIYHTNFHQSKRKFILIIRISSTYSIFQTLTNLEQCDLFVDHRGLGGAFNLISIISYIYLNEHLGGVWKARFRRF